MTKKSTATAQAETNQVEEVAAEPAAQAPDINLQDLQLMKQIIDLCSTRGAFKPNEMTAVGNVYTKLDNFLQAVAEQQKAAEGGN